MYKILIVDDEALARRDILFKLSRSGFNFEWIMEASDGAEALDIIAKNRPDILITDVVMNQISGIDLLRTCQQEYPSIVPIIICGYADFTFAQQAIELNVIQYLLKPVKADELKHALSKAILKLDSERKSQALFYKNDLLSQRLNDKELQDNFNLFLNCNITPDQFKIASVFPEDTHYYMIGIYRLSVAEQEYDLQPKASDQQAAPPAAEEEAVGRPKKRSFTEKDLRLLQYGVKNIMVELGGSYLLPLANANEGHQIIAVTASPQETLQQGYSELKRLHQSIYSAITNHLGVTVSVGLSSASETLQASQMTEARSMVDLRLYSPGWLCAYPDHHAKAPASFPEAELKQYQQNLENGDLPKALMAISNILDSGERDFSIHTRVIYIEMICILVRVCCKRGINLFSILGSESINGTVIDQFETKEELFTSLKQTVTAALSQWVDCNANTDTILQNVKEYIEDNFRSSDLSIKNLSQQFSISMGYLSASFVRLFGTNPSKYIVALRMEYACKLLKTTKMSITAISEAAGYSSMSYFMRAFKKQYNCTPTEYRNAK